MTRLLTQLINDENGFVVSAELVLVGTILVLGMIVGLAELSFNVNQELEDVGSAVASMNQSYSVEIASGCKAWVADSCFHDQSEFCESQFDIVCTN